MADAAPQTNEAAKPLSKSEKAAVLLLCMDEKTTSDLFSQLEDDEIRRIASSLLKISQIPNQQIQHVLSEFTVGYAKSRQAETTSSEVNVDGGKIAEKLLTKSMSKNRSQQILNSLKGNTVAPVREDTKFQDIIQGLSADDLYILIKSEHPQVIAIALGNAKRTVSKIIIEKFNETDRVDIVQRLAGLEKISGPILEELKTYLSLKIQENKSTPQEEKAKEVVTEDMALEGLEETVRMLKSINRDEAQRIIEEIEKSDPELGKAIGKRMFVMNDLTRSNDAGMRELLRAITTDNLKVALKNESDELKQKIFKNMSERASMILKEDMEVMGPLKVEEVESAQEIILRAAKELIKEQKMILEEAQEVEE